MGSNGPRLLFILGISIIHIFLLGLSTAVNSPIVYKCLVNSSVKASVEVRTAGGNAFNLSLSDREKPLTCPLKSPLSIPLWAEETSLKEDNEETKKTKLDSSTNNTNNNQSLASFSLNPRGYLRKEEEREGVIAYFHPSLFCISQVTSTNLEVELCKTATNVTSSEGAPSANLTKCCPSGSSLATEGPDVLCKAWEKQDSKFNVADEFISQLNYKFPNQDIPEVRIGPFNNLSNGTCSFKVLSGQSVEHWLEALETHQKSDEGTLCLDVFEENKKSPVVLARPKCDVKIHPKREIARPILYKCSAEVKETEFSVPDLWRLKYSEAKLKYFSSSVINYPKLYEFALKESEPNCADGTFTVTIFTRNNSAMVGEGNSTAHLNFTPDGYIAYVVTDMSGVTKAEDAVPDEIYYDRENFCLSKITKETLSVNICKSKCFHFDQQKGQNMCIPKCCYLGAVMKSFGNNDLGCSFSVTGDWTPQIYASEMSKKPETDVYPQLHFNYDGQIHLWKCEDDPYPVETVRNRSDFRILSDGRVLLRRTGRNGRIAWEEVFDGNRPIEFCIDGYYDPEKSPVYDPETAPVYMSRCDTRTKNQQKLEAVVLRTKIQIFVTLLPCAIIHFITIAVYVALWNKQNVHGWTVMAFAASQCLLYCFYCIILGGVVFGDIIGALLDNAGLCVSIGVMHHFFSISSFSWTTIMTYDVWAKLSSMKITSQNSRGKKRFLWYAAFAVGVPTLIILIGLTVEFAASDDIDSIIKPGYQAKCIISGPKAFLLWLGLTNTTLFLVNLIFAGLTFKSLWDAKKSVEVLKNANSKQSKASAFEKKFALIGKLMLLMGFFLIFEFIFNYGNVMKYSHYFLILDIYRLFHALGIFWIFVCSKKTLKQLQERYPRVTVLRKVKKDRIYSDASGMDTKETSVATSANELRSYKTDR